MQGTVALLNGLPATLHTSFLFIIKHFIYLHSFFILHSISMMGIIEVNEGGSRRNLLRRVFLCFLFDFDIIYFDGACFTVLCIL